MTTTNPTSAHHSRSRSSRRPHGRGIYVLIDAGPERRAILYADPEPTKQND